MKACTEGQSFKLRSGTPQAVCGNGLDTADCLCSDQANLITTFVMQTFGGEITSTRTYSATTEIAESADFIGLNPAGTLESASYNGTNYVTALGELVLTGQEQGLVEYASELDIPGVRNFIFR